MVSKEQKKEMMDYLVSRLEPVNERVIPRNREIVSGIVSNYIMIGDSEGIVLLVDQIYRGNSFEDVHGRARAQFRNVASVVIKDGQTFFRNAMERNYFKKDRELSLKMYSDEEMRRMILFRPEESFLFNVQRGWLQYFQPKSEQLEKGIESFRFESVSFDYSHIDSHEKFKPQNTDSRKLYIWTRRVHNEGNLKIVQGFLRNDS